MDLIKKYAGSAPDREFMFIFIETGPERPRDGGKARHGHGRGDY
jgi:hypothetical protein